MNCFPKGIKMDLFTLCNKMYRQLPRVSKDNLLSELRHRQYGQNRIPPRTGGTR